MEAGDSQEPSDWDTSPLVNYCHCKLAYSKASSFLLVLLLGLLRDTQTFQTKPLVMFGKGQKHIRCLIIIIIGTFSICVLFIFPIQKSNFSLEEARFPQMLVTENRSPGKKEGMF